MQCTGPANSSVFKMGDIGGGGPTLRDSQKLDGVFFSAGFISLHLLARCVC